jgi:hypothetical protein
MVAVSPVRDLSDLWRWISVPIPAAEVVAALTAFASFERQPRTAPIHSGLEALELWLGGQRVRAELVLKENTVERIELTAVDVDWLTLPSTEARTAMLAIATALRRSCGCLAVAL